MIPVDDAVAKILETARPLPVEEQPLDSAVGRYLAEEIRASADMPPFDRSAMDGYAVRAADTASVPVELPVVEEIAAGTDPEREVGPGEASRIMTGAAIPGGADAVVMVEDTQSLDDGGRVRIGRSPRAGQHIRVRGEDMKAGSILLRPGIPLGAPEAALLAGEGRTRVVVGGLPGVALISTGDELVPIYETPTGSRIRETNSWSLGVLLRGLGIQPRLLGIAPDRPGALDRAVDDGLKSDVLILTGGVSMGEYDLVGERLKEAGCRTLFEKVAIQPGKPIVFGVAPERGTFVFGLPGNPVSAVVDFLVFVRPALRAMMGAASPGNRFLSAILAEPVRRKGGRRGFLPGWLEPSEDRDLRVRPIPSMGSADMVALSRSNVLLVAPESESSLEPGRRVDVLPLDDTLSR